MTTKKSLGSYVNILPEDIPTQEQLLAAAERLAKDATILRSYNTPSKEEEAKGFDPVASFLKMLAGMKR